jgi:hypothetical protein
MLSGRTRRFENTIAATILINLALWFFLSQQSRYVAGLIFPLTVLAGGAIARLQIGKVLAVATVINSFLGIVVVYQTWAAPKLPVVLGKIDRDAYLKESVSFYEPAKFLNEQAKGGRVALFDEVFGYFLDVPYFWANPGHTTELGYDKMQTGADLADALKKIGITHVYFNGRQAYQGQPEEWQKWLAATGLQGSPVPYPEADRAQRFEDLRNKYKVMLAEAVAMGRLQPVKAFGRGIVFVLR